MKISYSNTYGTFGDLFWSPDGSRQATRSSRICETRLFITITPYAL